LIARLTPYHPYARRPDAAYNGLKRNEIVPQQINNNNTNSTTTTTFPLATKFIQQSKGYCHTGANVDANYQHPPSFDYNYKSKTFGNNKPTLIGFTTLPPSNLRFF
jgi:hypothetical protein